jgi:Protein of unknown function (DUF3617)
MSFRIMAATAALALAACNNQQEAGNAAANGAAADGGNVATAAGGDAGTAGAAMVEMRPGQWETTVEVLRLNMANVPGMPAGMTQPLPPPTTVRSCVTPEQARRPNADMFAGGNQAGCTYENFSMTGGRMQGVVTCNSSGTTVRSTFNGSFGAESMQVESETQVSANGVTVDTASRVTGRRLGDCPA